MPEQTQRNIAIKEPESPASAAQMGLIGALAEAGVVSAEQMAALGDAPTKQAASDLIAAHSGEEAFKAVQEARRTAPAERRTPAQKEPQRADFAHVKMPAAFVTPHSLEAKDGRTFDKAYVRLPDGVEVNKVDLSGYSLDVFMTDRMTQQKLLGEPVMLSFKADEPVTVWKGRKDDPDYKRFEVKPWDLVKAVNANNKEYEAAKQAERESALDAAAKEAREAADGLAGHDENVRPEQAR